MVTIDDVAARAGVGVGTVSRVLNDSPKVSAATRERVLTAMTDLDYRPSPLARTLREALRPPIPDRERDATLQKEPPVLQRVAPFVVWLGIPGREDGAVRRFIL